MFENQQLKNISKLVNCTESTVTVSWIEPNATDNSGEYTLSSNYKPGDEFAVGETTIVTYTAVDPSGNVASFSFFVTLLGKLKFANNIQYYFKCTNEWLQTNSID